MTRPQSFVRGAALAILALCTAAPALAQFPAKPVHIIVPFPPGGGADALARLMRGGV